MKFLSSPYSESYKEQRVDASDTKIVAYNLWLEKDLFDTWFCYQQAS